ncbi:hypothetical protein FALBO_15878 [Fusarium albosuccineum]|uniref:Uncharacterized protein n=1 Tax=Fusarium albosuccineum TaxID=1237068 RepID=A0A8H4NWT4_9HYPO|nr:hypothetical protein FALBO_15878 [Fusarium albosuccineum]
MVLPLDVQRPFRVVKPSQATRFGNRVGSILPFMTQTACFSAGQFAPPRGPLGAGTGKLMLITWHLGSYAKLDLALAQLPPASPTSADGTLKVGANAGSGAAQGWQTEAQKATGAPGR